MLEAYETIVTETRERVGLIRLNRPKQLNALNDTLMLELGKALAASAWTSSGHRIRPTRRSPACGER